MRSWAWLRFDTSEMGTHRTGVCAHGTAVFAIPLGEGEAGAAGQSVHLAKDPQPPA
ncbi:hypothetical protein [Pseudarthrobacter sp. N5]|uniref:hypothetical protein n=1 Tax=Pseudarthrobacter sp. N5 TaxID=3418416 RepID=UPI003CFA6A8A